ncbi:unnamed protein product, partial [Polarella glacialis]
MVVGPMLQLNPNTTMLSLRNWFRDGRTGGRCPNDSMSFVDVRDCAEQHVRAMEDETKQGRYMSLISGLPSKPSHFDQSRTQSLGVTFRKVPEILRSAREVGTMSKFGKYYKHDWYAQSRDTAENISEERQSVQAFEEELMQEALGLKPKKLLLAKVQMNEQELKEFLKAKKGEDKNGREVMGPQKKIMTNEYGEQVSTSNEEYIGDAFRDAQIKGLGFAHHRDAKLEKIKAEVMGTKSELKGKEAPAAPPPVKGEVKEEIDESKVKAELDDDDDARSTIGVASVGTKRERVD